MNKQEAIDSLECFRRNTAHILGDNDEKVKTIETCIMLVREAEETERWIPVTERLPEERQEILATTTDNAWGDVVIIRTYYKEMHKSVIAWMPLPEPYKEVRDEYSN